jgi:hypothetical protein
MAFAGTDFAPFGMQRGSPCREKRLLRRILIVDDEQAVLATLRDFFV